MRNDNIYAIMESVTRDFNRYIDDMMYAGLAESRTILPIVLIPFILISLVILYRENTNHAVLFRQGGKLAMATTLILGSGYVVYIHDMWLNDITGVIARGVNGSGQDITITQLFYNVTVAIENLQTGALVIATGPLAIVDRGVVQLAGGIAKAIIGVGYIIYQAVNIVSMLAVAIGAWFLAFLLFDATRGWAFNILGQIVSLTGWKLGMAIVIKVMVNRMGAQIRMTDALSGTMDIAGRIDQLFNIIITALCSAILMVIVGKITAVGGGYAASAVSSAVTGSAPAAMASLGREVGRLASNIGKMSKK
jgi:hypothetical protein